MAIPAEWEGASPMNEEKQKAFKLYQEAWSRRNTGVDYDDEEAEVLAEILEIAMMIGKDKGFLAGIEQGFAEGYRKGLVDRGERIIKMLEFYDLGDWVGAQDFVNRFVQALKLEQ